MSSLTVPGPTTPRTPQDWAELYRWPTTPTLRANMVTSLDGRSTVDGLSGGLGSPQDQQLLSILRATADVVLVGAGTVRSEGYDGVGTGAALRRSLRADRKEPVRLAIVTAAGISDKLSALDTAAARPLVLTTGKGAARTVAGRAEVVVVGADEVDPNRLRQELLDRGFARILCEGGPTLLGTMVDAALVDELCLTHAPLLIGAAGRELVDLASTHRWELVHAVAAGDHLFTRHRRSSR